jgi:di/tricarboxylate transporter
MMPKYGIISWKQGINSVSWNLIVFVAAATALGKVLVDTGIVKWIEKKMLNGLHLFIDAPEWLIVLLILLVTVTSHLYITSHTTRAIVFIPSLLLFSETIGVNSSTVVFLSLIGMNYCVTVPVSSKALLLFYEEGEISYDVSHLLKISAILMPLYILVIMLFYFSYWQWTGLHL